MSNLYPFLNVFTKSKIWLSDNCLIFSDNNNKNNDDVCDSLLSNIEDNVIFWKFSETD